MRILECFEYSSNIKFLIFVFDSKMRGSKFSNIRVDTNIQKYRPGDPVVLPKMTDLSPFSLGAETGDA